MIDRESDNTCFGQDDKHFGRRNHLWLLREVLFVVGHHVGILNGQRDFVKDLVRRVRVQFRRWRSARIDSVCFEL